MSMNAAATKGTPMTAIDSDARRALDAANAGELIMARGRFYLTDENGVITTDAHDIAQRLLTDGLISDEFIGTFMGIRHGRAAITDAGRDALYAR